MRERRHSKMRSDMAQGVYAPMDELGCAVNHVLSCLYSSDPY